jgi:hypothetical protein
MLLSLTTSPIFSAALLWNAKFRYPEVGGAQKLSETKG